MTVGKPKSPIFLFKTERPFQLPLMDVEKSWRMSFTRCLTVLSSHKSNSSIVGSRVSSQATKADGKLWKKCFRNNSKQRISCFGVKCCKLLVIIRIESIGSTVKLLSEWSNCTPAIVKQCSPLPTPCVRIEALIDGSAERRAAK